MDKVNEIVYESNKKNPYIKFLDVCIDCADHNSSQELSNFLHLKLEIPDWENKPSSLSNQTNLSSHNGDHLSCRLSDILNLFQIRY